MALARDSGLSCAARVHGVVAKEPGARPTDPLELIRRADQRYGQAREQHAAFLARAAASGPQSELLAARGAQSREGGEGLWFLSSRPIPCSGR